MMFKKNKNMFVFIILFIFVLVYTVGVIPVNIDEIWEYGYGYNISTGMIPYRDFNMVATPLYALIISLFIKLFGPYLISVNIFNAIVIAGVFYFIYKMIGYKMVILIPLIMIFSYPTYNNFVMFLFFLFIYIKRKDIDKNKKIILSSLIISFIFLTKQSVGIVLFILEFFLTDNKKKYICIFLIPVFILTIYLVINNAFYQFVDYSFLGLFDFGTRNGNFNPAILSSIFICVILFWVYRTYKKNEILYFIFYQVITFPIFDFFHLMLGLIVFIFILLDYYSEKILKSYVIVLTAIFSFYLIYYNINVNFIYKSFIMYDNNYLYLKRVNESSMNIITGTANIFNKYNGKYDKIYNLTRHSYYFKLYSKYKIDKFDMILNGNMGYKGYNKYISDIDKNCKEKKCLFIIAPGLENNYMQKNYEILDYISNNYTLIDSNLYLGYDIYSN